MSTASRPDLPDEAVRLREQDGLEDARQRLLAAVRRHPDDAGILYQAASVHDRLGRESEAVDFYERCLDGSGLPDEDRRTEAPATVRAESEHGEGD